MRLISLVFKISMVWTITKSYAILYSSSLRFRKWHFTREKNSTDKWFRGHTCRSQAAAQMLLRHWPPWPDREVFSWVEEVKIALKPCLTRCRQILGAVLWRNLKRLNWKRKYLFLHGEMNRFLMTKTTREMRVVLKYYLNKIVKL